MKIERRPFVLAICLVLTCGMALFYFANWSDQPASPAEQVISVPAESALLGGTPEPTSSVNPLGGISLGSLSETTNRPLFDPSRRRQIEEEPQVEKVESVADKPGIEDVTLLGVLVTNDDKIAVLNWKKNSEIIRLKVGQTFSEWTLKAIQPKKVVLRSSDQTFELELFQAPAASAAKAGDDPLEADDPRDGDNPQDINNLSQL